MRVQGVKFQCKLCRSNAEESPMTALMEELLEAKFRKHTISEVKQIGELTFKLGFCKQCRDFFSNKLSDIDQFVLLHMINVDKFSVSGRNNLRRSIQRWKGSNKETLAKLEVRALVEAL